MPFFDLISFYENARFSFLKTGSNFLVYTVFTFMASFFDTIYLLILFANCLDIHFLMLVLANVYYVYTYFT